MTLLVGSIFADNVELLQQAAEIALTDGADAVEARLDTFTGNLDELIRLLNQASKLSWIVTCRPPAEGGRFAGQEEERVKLLATLARETDAYVDFELADWISSGGARRELTEALTSRCSHPRLILSAHESERVPAEPEVLIREAHHARHVVAAAKVAFEGKDATASLYALDLMQSSSGPVVAIAMGEAGVVSRVLARKRGGWASYACLDKMPATAPGQVSVRDVKELYRWDVLDESTRVFGVIGAPVSHSMSPVLFNRWFAEAGVNAVFLPFHVAPEPIALAFFLDGCRNRPWLDWGGGSVTLPHKTNALNYLGQSVDETARKIGAVNTLTLSQGRLTGCNTDCPAALASLRDAVTRRGRELGGLNVDVLGTGGVARALVAGLTDAGCVVTIYGRDVERAAQLAAEFAAGAAPWAQRTQLRGSVIVNCTNVGMTPKVKASPLSSEGLAGCELVFDVIYNPAETALLRQAAQAGSATLGGLDMFIRQAALQFELWTGRLPDLQLGRQLVTAKLAEAEAKEPA